MASGTSEDERGGTRGSAAPRMGPGAGAKAEAVPTGSGAKAEVVLTVEVRSSAEAKTVRADFGGDVAGGAGLRAEGGGGADAGGDVAGGAGLGGEGGDDADGGGVVVVLGVGGQDPCTRGRRRLGAEQLA